jgi:RHS repeat-associated protein
MAYSALSGCGASGATVPLPYKTDGECPTCFEGNPVGVSTGNKFQKEMDYQAGTANDLSLARYYNSDPSVPQGSYGWNWRGTFDRQIVLSSDSSFSAYKYSGPLLALSYRPDGRIVTFNVAGPAPVATDPDTVETLSQPNSSTWVLTTKDDTVETYTVVSAVKSTGPRSFGQLASIQFRGGLTLSLSYDSNQNLLTVSDPFGHSLGFTHDSNNRVSTMVDTGGNTWFYAYNSSNYLTDLYSPGPTKGSESGAPHRQYRYSSFATGFNGTATEALSYIEDESTYTYATWTYNSNSQVASSYHGSYEDDYTFTYGSGTPGTSSTVTDTLGGSRQYTFSVVNGVPKATSIVASGSVTESSSFDSRGNPTTTTDPNGNITNYSIDARGLEESRTEGANTGVARTTTTTWHPTFHTPTLQAIYSGTTATGTPVQTKTWSYDTLGNMLQMAVTDPATDVSRLWTYTYDGAGHVLTTQSPRTDVSAITTYTYNTCNTGGGCGRVASITDPLGHVTTITAYNADGFPLSLTDPNGTVTAITYDPMNRLASQSIGGVTTTYAYYPTGLLETVTIPDGVVLTFSYDGAHKLTQISDSAGNKVIYTIDSFGNRKADKYYESSTLDRAVYRTFDSLGRLSALLGAADTGAVTTTLSYDSNDNLLSVAAPLSRTSSNSYDALDRLSQAIDPIGGTTQYQYDILNNVVSLTDPRSLVTTDQYDGLSNLTQQTSPDSDSQSFGYDSAGNLVSTVDARGVTSTFTFDTMDRMTSALYGSDPAITYSYDSGTNGVGRLTGISDTNQSMTFGYNAQGRVTSRTQTVGGLTRTTQYQYTSDDLTQITTPSGHVVAYGYSNHDISTISIDGVRLLGSAGYQAFGPVHSWTWGNSTTEKRLYNTDGESSQTGSAELLSYGYDNAFRIVTITDAANSALSWTAGYDASDRLASAGQGSVSFGWTYDADGNRLSQTGTTAGTLSIAGGSNRLSSVSGGLSQTYSYDAAGNVLSNGTLSFSYNGRGRRSSSTSASATTNYLYNALGERIMKSGGPAGTVIFMYDEAGHLVGEYTAAGALIEETIWLKDLPVATIAPNGSGTPTVYYIHADQLGAPRIITLPSNNSVVWRWDADSFGTVAPNQNPSGAGIFNYNLRFPGQYADVESGTFYNYYRDYDPNSDRYQEPDPVGIASGPNGYVYVNASPLRHTDSFGLVDLNLFPPTDTFHAWAELTPSPNNTFTVAGHGNPYDIRSAKGDVLHASELAAAIKASPKWRPGMKVQLLSCNTGYPLYHDTNLAQALAKLLGTTVEGTDNFVWFKSNGSYEIAPTNQSNVRWNNYTPQAGASGENPKLRGRLIPYAP